MVISNGAASGELYYVTGYTGFSSNVEEQSGNYIALKVNGAPEDAVVTYEKVGGSAEPVVLDQDRNIVIRIVDQSAVLRFTITTSEGSVTRDISVANLTFDSAQAEEPEEIQG